MQVLSVQQLAEVVVHCYPYLPTMETLLESVAAGRGASDAPSHPTSDQHGESEHTVTEWATLTEYTALLATQTYHDYLPLLPFLGKSASI